MSLTNQEKNREKARHHLERMEHWQAVIDDAEQRALALANPSSPQKSEYQVQIMLENNFDYNLSRWKQELSSRKGTYICPCCNRRALNSTKQY